MVNKVKPQFYGIGAQKAGTTWLYANLNKLPDFDLLPIKELHYFDRSKQYPSASDLVETLLKNRLKDRKWLREALKHSLFSSELGLKSFYFKWYFSNYTDQWYLSLFNKTKGISGEITPSYSFLVKEDIKRMYNLSPEAKLIFMVRNPIERAWSQFRFESRNKMNFDIQKVSDDEIIAFMNKKSQLLRSDYLLTISNYTSVFPKDQLLICFFDAITASPLTLLTEIVQFIGLECDQSYIQKNAQFTAKKNVSQEMDCPPKVLEHLKMLYSEPIKLLADRYGSYFNVWLEEYYSHGSSASSFKLTPTIQL